MEKKRVAFLTLGCKVNSYETDAMQKLFEDAGYETVTFYEDAEVYVINTCTVTNIADRKSRQMLHKARKLHPSAVIVAAGCYVQTAQKEAAADSAVDIVVGNNEKAEIVIIVENYQRKRNAVIETAEPVIIVENSQRKRNAAVETAEIHIKDISSQTEYENLFITGAGEHTRASIKIQDGCNQFCSYCIIPYARGRIRSRALPDILKEVTGLAAAGYQEIILTGIHLSSYGMDFTENKVDFADGGMDLTENKVNFADDGMDLTENKVNFADDEKDLTENKKDFAKAEMDFTEKGKQLKSKPLLLKVIEEVSKIEGIKRIRLGSLEPNIITEEFITPLIENTKFCPHFHLSLQSGCNETLKRMNRHYTAEEYLEKCKLLRKYFDQPAITTDVITGFPGETEEEFEISRSFLEKAAFSQMHIFPYSKRHGTRAERMPNQVTEDKKKQRSEILLALEKKMRHNYQDQFIGTKQEILLEEKISLDGAFYWVGHTMRYVKIAMPVWNQENMSNQLVMGEITGRIGEDILISKQYREE